ncbi:MAG: SH3 domain-containing protein [Caldilineaceae bacterium]
MEKRCITRLSKAGVSRLVFGLSLLALPWLAGCNLLFQAAAAEENPTAEATSLPPWLMPLTATPLPPPTATPLPTPTARPRVIVNDDVVNVRAQPDKAADILGTVVKDMSLELLGQNDTGEWFQVCCVQGEPGWVFHELVQQQTQAASVAAANVAQTPVAVAITGWQTFAAPELGFSIVLPGMPMKQTATLQTSAGTLDYYLFPASLDGIRYTIGFANLPNTAVPSDELLNSVRADLVAKAQGQVSQEQTIDQGDVLGRELTIVLPNARNTLLARVYVKAPRLYVLTVTAPKEAMQSENVERFLNSFQVLEK